jgi:hypothetical protein
VLRVCPARSVAIWAHPISSFSSTCARLYERAIDNRNCSFVNIVDFVDIVGQDGIYPHTPAEERDRGPGAAAEALNLSMLPLQTPQESHARTELRISICPGGARLVDAVFGDGWTAH